MERGYQWPDPGLSLNPTFASGGTITELVATGLLQPECERIFRLKESDPDGLSFVCISISVMPSSSAPGSSYVLTTERGRARAWRHYPDRRPVLAAKAAGTYRARDQGYRGLPDECAG